MSVASSFKHVNQNSMREPSSPSDKILLPKALPAHNVCRSHNNYIERERRKNSPCPSRSYGGKFVVIKKQHHPFPSFFFLSTLGINILNKTFVFLCVSFKDLYVHRCCFMRILYSSIDRKIFCFSLVKTITTFSTSQKLSNLLKRSNH